MEKIGADVKNHPLRQAYETEVAALKEEAELMAKSGQHEEIIAEKMWQRRREIGLKYKEMTPEPLREYIFEINTKRYGDPLGPSFESLVKSAKMKGENPFQSIIESSTRPNKDVNVLLSKFEDWLSHKEPPYLDSVLRKLEI